MQSPLVRWILFFAFFFLAVAQPAGHGLWLLLTLWTTYLSLLRAGQFQQFCAGQDGAVVFVGMPVSSQEVFDLGAARIFRSSLWLGGDALIAIATATVVAQGLGKASQGAWWGVLPAAFLFWGVAPVTAIILLWHWPRVNYSSYATTLLSLCVIAGIAMGRTSIVTFGQLGSLFALLTWVTPAGWTSQLAMWVVGDQAAFPVVPLAFLAVSFTLAVRYFHAISDQFRIYEKDEVASESRPEDDSSLEIEAELAAHPLVESRVSDVEEHVESGTFLQPFTCLVTRWIERLILACMRGHASQLDFMIGTSPGWSAMYRFALMTLVAGTLLAWAAEARYPTVAYSIAALSSLIVLGFTTPLFGGTWQGFLLGNLGHRRVAVLSMFPVSLREVRRIILAVNAIRFLLALPCWLLMAMLVALHDHRSLSATALLAVEWWLIALLLQPFFLVFKYSPGTNDTSAGCLTAFMILFAGLMPVGAVAAVLLAIFIPARPFWQVAAFLALAAASFGFEAFYRRLYNGRRFDLLAKMSA